MNLGVHAIRAAARSVWLQRLVRWSLGGLFVYAGALKLGDPLAFAIQIEKHGVLPAAWLDPAARLIPLSEIAAGLLTLFNRRGGAETLALLLAVFLAVLSWSWWRGLDVPCGCFSSDDEQHRYGIQLAILRDLVMLAGAALLICTRRSRPVI